jgi:hypothetical protein
MLKACSIPSISASISPETHLVITIINGLGDSLLALPVLRRLIKMCGPHFVTVWAPIDVIETVFFGLNCNFLPIHLDRYRNDPFFKEVEDLENALNVLSKKSPLFWVGLNAYFPLWPIEQRAREALRPNKIWDFGTRAETFQRDQQGHIIPMRSQYFAVLGEPVDDNPLNRSPIISDSARVSAKSFVANFCHHSRGFIAIHTDSLPEKEWSIGAWQEFARLLLDCEGLSIVALGKPSPLLTTSETLIAPPPTDWHVQVALLEQSSGFVGIDSCFGHIADALGVPGVVLFGPTSVEEWGPKGPAVRALVAPESKLTHLGVRDVFDALVSARMTAQRS